MSATAFPRFPELATELQIEIWKLAFPATDGTAWMPNYAPTKYFSRRVLLAGPFSGRVIFRASAPLLTDKWCNNLLRGIRVCKLARQSVLERWRDVVKKQGHGSDPYNDIYLTIAQKAEKEKEVKAEVLDVLEELLQQMRGDEREVIMHFDYPHPLARSLPKTNMALLQELMREMRADGMMEEWEL